MRVTAAVASGLVLAALSVPSSAAAQADPPPRGTLELGMFVAEMRLDERAGLSDGKGLGVRAGVALGPRWLVELEAAKGFLRDSARALVRVVPAHARVTYAQPIGGEVDGVLVAGIGLARTDHSRSRTWGPSALLGVKGFLAEWLALRLDAVADYAPGPGELNVSFRYGLSVLLRPRAS